MGEIVKFLLGRVETTGSMAFDLLVIVLYLMPFGLVPLLLFVYV